MSSIRREYYIMVYSQVGHIYLIFEHGMFKIFQQNEKNRINYIYNTYIFN